MRNTFLIIGLTFVKNNDMLQYKWTFFTLSRKICTRNMGKHFSVLNYFIFQHSLNKFIPSEKIFQCGSIGNHDVAFFQILRSKS